MNEKPHLFQADAHRDRRDTELTSHGAAQVFEVFAQAFCAVFRIAQTGGLPHGLDVHRPRAEIVAPGLKYQPSGLFGVN